MLSIVGRLSSPDKSATGSFRGTPTIYQQSQPTGGPRRSLIRLIRHRAILRAWKKYIAGRGARR
ncbi:hypothetical protein G3M48_004073 [Beauveria asiatica]|uniref:Uncharacterized protein n=1 Tax=Beauveria asiatica TaxID=1069075 RepID=A0AAW0RU02_9HYPO